MDKPVLSDGTLSDSDDGAPPEPKADGAQAPEEAAINTNESGGNPAAAPGEAQEDDGAAAAPAEDAAGEAAADPFVAGALMEVTSFDEGLRGSWYEVRRAAPRPPLPPSIAPATRCATATRAPTRR